jgi:endonuclease/exonuclease/phosphatase family metal-dependent hydrolase
MAKKTAASRTTILALIFATALMLPADPAPADFESSVRIATWNIKQNKRQNQHRYPWSLRKSEVLKTFGAVDADLIGIQEQFLPGGCPQGNRGDPRMGYALRDILEAFPDYAVAQQSCALVHVGAPILYRKSRFALVTHGTTKGCGGFYTARHFGWAKFREISSAQEILFFNAHLSLRPTLDRLVQARVLGCDIAAKKAASGHAMVPIAVVGDMNDPYLGPVMSFLTHEGDGLDGEGLYSEYRLVEVVGTEPTHRGGEHLDHIYLDSILVDDARRAEASGVGTSSRGGQESGCATAVDAGEGPHVPASDHCIVWAVVRPMPSAPHEAAEPKPPH